MLGELQDASLILSYESGSTMRYRMLEPVREYIHGRLAEGSERQELAARHSTYFIGLAEEAETGLRGSEQADWLQRLDDDLPNLRAALSASETADRLKAAAGLQRFWVARGRIGEGREWVGESMDALDVVDKTERGSVTLSAEIMAMLTGDFESARVHFQSSLTYCRACSNDQGAIKALANLANIKSQIGNHDEARKAYEAGLEVARRSGDERLAVHC